jgi:hypothetical protein
MFPRLPWALNAEPCEGSNLLLRKCKLLYGSIVLRQPAKWRYVAYRQTASARMSTSGHGKRMLVRGGKLDPKFNITVPESIDAAG